MVVTRLDLSNVHVYGLGFREQRVQVISSANKQGHKAIFYPGSGPRRVILYVLLVCIAFDGVVTIGEIALARKAKAIVSCGYGCSG